MEQASWADGLGGLQYSLHADERRLTLQAMALICLLSQACVLHAYGKCVYEVYRVKHQAQSGKPSRYQEALKPSMILCPRNAGPGQ